MTMVRQKTRDDVDRRYLTRPFQLHHLVGVHRSRINCAAMRPLFSVETMGKAGSQLKHAFPFSGEYKDATGPKPTMSAPGETDIWRLAYGSAPSTFVWIRCQAANPSAWSAKYGPMITMTEAKRQSSPMPNTVQLD